VITRVQKWGNSLGVRIPKLLAEHARVRAGSSVDMNLEGGRLVIAPVEKGVYDLADLLSQVTPDNLHGEVDVGRPRGREVW